MLSLRTYPPTVTSLWILLLLCGGCTERSDEPRTVVAAPPLQTPHSTEKASSISSVPSPGDRGPSSPISEPEQSDGDLDLLAGVIDTENRFLFAVDVGSPLPNGRGEGTSCSGVLLAPRLVLTAGHCVCKRRQLDEPGREGRTLIDGSSCATRASVSTAMYEPPPPGGETSFVREKYRGQVQPHPEFKLLLDSQGDVISSKADLALILLDSPVAPEIPPVALAEAGVAAGESIIMVSFGYDLALGRLGNERRLKEYKVTRLSAPGDERVLFHQSQRQFYTGDSGGPCLRQNEHGFSLVGISSRALGKEPGFTEIQPYRAWINAELHRAPHPAPASPR
jgi:hypothetical protein